MNLLSLAHQVVPRLRSIRKGTWIALGTGLFALLALFVWAGISLLAWLWGQAPGVAETGKRAAGVALEQAEQVIPGVREKVEQVVPGLKKQIGEVVPDAKEQIGIWLPGTVKKESAQRDVGGTDIGPVARIPELARSFFQRDERAIEVRYLGRADFQQVLNHYARGFEAAAYRQEVLSATRETEHHRYAKGSELIEFRVTHMPSGDIQVELKSTP